MSHLDFDRLSVFENRSTRPRWWALQERVGRFLPRMTARPLPMANSISIRPTIGSAPIRSNGTIR